MGFLASSRSSHALQVEQLRVDPALVTRGLDVEAVLGEGGCAVVYRARDARHQRDVAIKVIRETPALSHAAERFRQEIQVAAGLRHAHILPIIDSGTLEDGRPFSVMPVANGRPLDALIREGPLSVVDAVRLALETAEALAYLHARGFAHRDVKPENILVEGGHATLTDFGLAAPLSSGPASASVPHDATRTAVGTVDRFTPAGGAVGTLLYMSPELLRGDPVIHVHADIYALGVVLYEMLAGEHAHDTTSPQQILARLTFDGFPSVRAVRPDVPARLEAVIRRATAATPGDRFSSAHAMAEALGNVPVASGGARSIAAGDDPRPFSTALVALLGVLIVGALYWQSARDATALDPDRIVVADLANDTGDSTMSRLGVLAGDVITARLADRTKLSVVNAAIALPSRQQQNLPPEDSTLARATRALISSTRAGLVVTGAYFRAGDALNVLAEVTDTRSGRVLGAAGPVQVMLASPEAPLGVLADSIVVILQRRHMPPQ